jgi:hypothetical protein
MNGVGSVDAHEIAVGQQPFHIAERFAHERLPAVGEMQRGIVPVGFQVRDAFNFFETKSV